MSTIFTVGYERTDIERFVRTLLAAGVEVVADVRAVAVSRKKGFSKNKLAQELEAHGIGYRHFVQLGDPKPGRDAARAGNTPLFERIYGNHFQTEVAQSALVELSDLAKSSRIALLCFEHDPYACHRTIVAKQLARDLSLNIVNLFSDDPQRYVRLHQQISSVHPRQGIAAAE